MRGVVHQPNQRTKQVPKEDGMTLLDVGLKSACCRQKTAAGYPMEVSGIIIHAAVGLAFRHKRLGALKNLHM